MKEISVSKLRELNELSADVSLLLMQSLPAEDLDKCRQYFGRVRRASFPAADSHDILHAELAMRTALLFAEKVEPDESIILAILLAPFVCLEVFDIEEVRNDWGDDVAALIEGLQRVKAYSDAGTHADQDNFRGLLLTLASDIRVIIMTIVENLALMRLINLHPDDEWVRSVAFEAKHLYAQLGHRLGLYAIKGELEDLSLKYTNRDIYKQIAQRLNETKRSRDAYITSFIEPVRRKLTEAGLKFEIKGRTKSISSIWAKMQKQKVGVDGIYDLFAIRVILDSDLKREKQDCWLAYSIVADMYKANPKRMRDWLSVPKSNGYESLHATVMGPQDKWVEVQFRTARMDLVAEKGLAAHWRYKGGKSDEADRWMNNVRDILEAHGEGPMKLMKDIKIDAFSREVFAFTPKGELLRLKAGATVLDFAFAIHSRIGSQCTGAIINGHHQGINYKVRNGDTIEIITSSTQKPKQDWLGIVVTSKARNKIRQTLNDERLQSARLGKELLERRARNRKLDIDESALMRLIKKNGYKYANDFFADIYNETVDVARVLTQYSDLIERENAENETPAVSAEDFTLHRRQNDLVPDDILTIGDKSLRGMNYKFARCCNPINGDDVFGFISADGIVKIHKTDCPNAANIRSRYPYRLIKVRWSDGAASAEMPVTLSIVGADDIGIVTNITSMITKDAGCSLRNISIDSHDGLFRGYLVIGVRSQEMLTHLIKKLNTIKGVKNVTRL